MAEHEYEGILDRMLQRVSTEVDQREGSIIYDALAPAAVMFNQFYIDLDTNLNLSFADTSSESYLDVIASDLGIQRKPAIKAIRIGRFWDQTKTPFNIEVHSRFSADQVNFIAIKRLSVGVYELECETEGEIGNRAVGTLIPIDYIEGLANAELGEITIMGAELEDDEALRKRYFDRARKPITSGNKYHFEYWAKEVQGVFDARCIPLWQGAGTVKVVVIDADRRSPEGEKIEEVRQHITGLMPIGADLTVAGAEELKVNLSGHLTTTAGANLDSIIQAVRSALTEYMKSIALRENVIRYSQIANLILDVPGVIDYDSLTVNDGTGNVMLDEDQVGVLGEVNLI